MSFWIELLIIGATGVILQFDSFWGVCAVSWGLARVVEILHGLLVEESK